MTYKIAMLRGTMFCTPIKYSREFVEGLAGVADGYVPILMGGGEMFSMVPAWQLISHDEKEVLAFNGEKIDIIKVVDSEMDSTGLKMFGERCKEVFAKILEMMDYASTRVAFAPSVILTENADKPMALFSRLYRILTFRECPLETSNLSQVFRVTKEIQGKKVLVNHVANFHSDNQLINERGINRVRERYMCDFDINTMVNPDNKFTVSGVNEFFDMGSDCFEEFYNIYFT